AADLHKLQGTARAVAGCVPAPLGAQIAVGDIELMRSLAGPAIDKAAQAIKIRFRDVQKRRRVLGFRADEGDKARRQVLVSRDDRRTGGNSLLCCELSAGGQRHTQEGCENVPAAAGHMAPAIVSALSSPSRGAVLAKAGRAPSKDNGNPTSDKAGLPTHCWMIPRALVCGSVTTWSRVWIGLFGIPAASRRSAQTAIGAVRKRSLRIGTSSARLTTRSALVRNRGSSARPGRPIAAHRRRNKLSLPAATIM